LSEKIKEARIIALKAKNVKRLQAVEIHPPDGQSVVVVGGENAQGKTSVLDSIMYALAGGKSIPDDVVRHGEKKGEIELDLGELRVIRVLGKGAKLEVRAKDGEVLASPQTILDRLAGKLTFDPLHFQRLSETTAGRREQAEILKELLGLDFADEERAKKKLYDRRTEINRDLKKIEVQVDEMPFFPQVPDEKIDIAEVAEKLHQAANHNESQQKMQVELGQLEGELKKVQNQIAELQKRRNEIINEKVALAKKLAAFEKIDTADLKKKLETAQEVNEKREKNRQRQKLMTEASVLRKESEDLTDKIEKIEKKKQKALNEAEVPVKGLSFTDEGVMFNKVPFHNCSSAEQLKLSVAMGIKMNPSLKVMLIRDGSLLDDTSLEQLRKMAADSGHQVWLERVGKGEECTVIIEDGAVVK